MTITAAATSATTGAATSRTTISADFNMFLRMLTEQMKNQDPLDPMDATQFTGQLVQFSQVEQTVQQTGVLRDVLARIGGMDMMQAAGMIGREVRLDSPVTGLGQGKARWSYEIVGAPAAVTATITDAAGQVVHRRTLAPAASGQVEWDGAIPGGRAAPGAYTLTLSATDGKDATLATTITAAGTVRQVLSQNGTTMLDVDGATVPLTTLIGIAAPAAP